MAAGTAFGGNQASLHEFDTNNDNFNVNAVKIALEKALPDKNEWAAGFRIDTIYGSDAKYLGDSAFNGATTTGTNTINNSGLALEQALVKFRIPVGNGLDVYMGKFVTLLGYEVIESPANLNFSRGLLFTNAIPLTNTGIYFDYKFNDTFEAKLGIVDGLEQLGQRADRQWLPQRRHPVHRHAERLSVRRQGAHRPVEHQRPRQERQYHPVVHLLAQRRAEQYRVLWRKQPRL